MNLAIDGMSCGHCVVAVSEALAAVPGLDVQSVAVGAAVLTIDPQLATADSAIEAIRGAGYDARLAARPLPQAVGTTCCSPKLD